MVLVFKTGLLASLPLTDADFAALMASLGPWGVRQAVAVSGGADSLCLAWLAKRWGEPFAFIVDHGLRADSAEEAAVTKERLAAFGVPSRTLKLTGLTPGPGLAARAREARYAALVSACGGLGLSDLLLGHHAGDQAETVLMRQEAASGAWGRAGMSPVAHRRTVRLVRPFLGVAPARLRATLRATGLCWVEDPSNRDPAALRTRLRTRLEADESGLDARLARSACEAADARVLAAAAMASVLAWRAQIFPEGYAILSPGPIAPDCLGALIRMLGGRLYAAHSAMLARVAAAPGPATLGGVRLMKAGRLGAGLLLVREESAIGPDIEATSGAVWDSRFVVCADEAPPVGLRVSAVGAASGSLRGFTELPAAVVRTLPALWSGGSIAAVPHLASRLPAGAFTGWTNLRVKLTLCPPHPAASAG